MLSFSKDCAKNRFKNLIFLQAMDAEKRGQIIQEIAIMKGLSSHEHIVTFVTAATVDASSRVAAGKCDEFLVLMEFCPKNLADIIRTRSKPYPPATVAKIFCQVNRFLLLVCQHHNLFGAMKLFW